MKSIKKTAIAISVAALLGTGALGSNLPAAAAPKLDGINEKTAIEQGYLYKPNLSVKHDGITLKLEEVKYDGSTLSILIKREGANLDGTVSPYFSMEDLKENPNNEFIKKNAVPEQDQLKGYIKLSPEVLVDGESIKLNSASFSGPKNNFYYVAKGVKAPEKFELTIRAEVTKVSEPFELKVPIELKSKPFVIKPEASKTSGKFSYTVKQLELTPFSTRLILDSQGPVPASAEQSGKYHASKVYYELMDNKGKEINQETIGFFNKKPETKYHVDQFYYPIDDKVTSITIKPYTYTVNSKDWSILGAKKGSEGKRTYLKDLQVTIPINR
jgi:Family of unknown function (DUF5643)/Domain of unknown function (DUF4179)